MIHFSRSEITTLNFVEQTNTYFKPRGLWYSTDDNWMIFYVKNISKINDCQYMYKLKLHYTSFDHPDKNKILKLEDESSFDSFTLKYGTISVNELGWIFILINWPDVAKDYGGIEVIPLIKSRMDTTNIKVTKKYNKKFKFIKKTDKKSSYLLFWQKSLDVPSGCVWNPKAVKKIVRTYEI
jgi:hypothetical protein